MTAPRVTLGSWPTALEPAPRLAAALGLGSEDLWIKREDLGGLGAGGNKLRKLEFTVGAALADGADTLVTLGGAQSNHARLTAAVGARLGLRVVLVFPGRYAGIRNGNVALAGLFGAQVHWAGDVDFVGLAEVAHGITERLRADGARPVLLPLGGSSATGALGYEEAGRELLGQLPDLHTAVVALGSGGTMAGLVAALGPDRVLGVDVGAVADPAGVVAEFASQVGPRAVAGEQLRIDRDQVGAGYATVGEPVVEAMRLVARTEALVLDPIYTGRAMAALVAAVRAGTVTAGVPTVFLHTGGLPGLFGYPDAVGAAEQMLDSYPE
ncbi:D-cysteine desulfhydrase family protein [Jatrophihabitans sp.]|uniref:D-cysteine desulfhydrase family protein n=1 Tax=Jatrophihabitans sp. TaxID=1932789 RepID=UPI002B926A31|nr:D-cysteine desulfhydrase family protein [Jatrophihabitans sp.]